MNTSNSFSLLWWAPIKWKITNLQSGLSTESNSGWSRQNSLQYGSPLSRSCGVHSWISDQNKTHNFVMNNTRTITLAFHFKWPSGFSKEVIFTSPGQRTHFCHGAVHLYLVSWMLKCKFVLVMNHSWNISYLNLNNNRSINWLNADVSFSHFESFLLKPFLKQVRTWFSWDGSSFKIVFDSPFPSHNGIPLSNLFSSDVQKFTNFTKMNFLFKNYLYVLYLLSTFVYCNTGEWYSLLKAFNSHSPVLSYILLWWPYWISNL